jgi:hypothetical protein
MRAAEYDRSEVLELDGTPLNAVTSLLRGTFSRRRRDGSEIGRLTASYLVTATTRGPRISALVVHSP